MENIIAVDIETVDPNLKDKGDGSIRRDGKILCVSTYDGKQARTFRPDDLQLKSILLNPTKKIFHNGIYDLSWLYACGFTVNGKWEDTMVRAACINTHEPSYSLDALALKAGLAGKDHTIDQWGLEHGIIDVKKHLEEVPFNIMSFYCEQDVRTTYDLYFKQQPFITDLKLERLCAVESTLMKPILRMRLNGVRIDEPQRDILASKWQEEIEAEHENIMFETGIMNINSNKQKEAYFHEEGIHSTVFTPAGKESWGKDALADIDHPIAKRLVNLSSKMTVYNTFLNGGLKETVNGRLHTTFYSTHRDEGGTITGRFSSAHPNLQNIPSHEAKGGTVIRSLFLPEEGCTLGAYDYKQIEYRIFAHYAIGFKMEGWQDLQKAMIAGKDYHDHVSDLLGWDKSMRKIVKTINFGVLYGMGKDTCMKKNKALFITDKPLKQYVDELYDHYYTSLPFVRPTCTRIKERGASLGYVPNLLGRRHPYASDKSYKLVNYLVQGSASDILKLGIVEAEEAGIWDVLKLHLTVHDENVFSIPDTKAGREAADALKECMKTSLKLHVPIGVDAEEGVDWGHCA